MHCAVYESSVGCHAVRQASVLRFISTAACHDRHWPDCTVLGDTRCHALS